MCLFWHLYQTRAHLFWSLCQLLYSKVGENENEMPLYKMPHQLPGELLELHVLTASEYRCVNVDSKLHSAIITKSPILLPLPLQGLSFRPVDLFFQPAQRPAAQQRAAADCPCQKFHQCGIQYIRVKSWRPLGFQDQLKSARQQRIGKLGFVVKGHLGTLILSVKPFDREQKAGDQAARRS